MDTARQFGIEYRPRTLDTPLQEALRTAGAVVIEGPRACGKTMTGLNAAASFVFLDDPAARQLVELSPRLLLSGATPRLLDEWQLAPQLWNLVRRVVDLSDDLGQFILTGSAVPADDVTRHSGAGRFLRLRQRTMAWHERYPEEGVSFEGLLAGVDILPNPEALDYSAVIDRLLAPGFPGLLRAPTVRRTSLLDGYLDEVSRADIGLVGEVRHDPAVIRRLLTAIAQSSASPVTYTTLTQDTSTIAPGIKDTTVATYVGLLERLFVVERQAVWTPRLRSRARLRSHDKLHLADPSLAAVALGANAQRLARDPETVGLLFESAVFHDLSVLATRMGGQIRHYRDSNGRELDAVLTLPDGRWAAIEVKLGASQIPAAARSVAAAVAAIDTGAVGEPAFRLILTGTGPTFTLDDGTVTVPFHRLVP